jgi:hypothetical protein
LLDRHEVENGRKGRCRKRKAKDKKATEEADPQVE